MPARDHGIERVGLKGHRESENGYSQGQANCAKAVSIKDSFLGVLFHKSGQAVTLCGTYSKEKGKKAPNPTTDKNSHIKKNHQKTPYYKKAIKKTIKKNHKNHKNKTQENHIPPPKKNTIYTRNHQKKNYYSLKHTLNSNQELD